MVVVLGIDPGTAHTGYGVVLSRGQTLAALDGGVIDTRPGPLERRLAEIHARVCDLISEHSPDAVAVEELYFGRNVRTALAVGQARGVILLSAGMAGIPCFACSTRAVSKNVRAAAFDEQYAAWSGMPRYASAELTCTNVPCDSVSARSDAQ